MGMILTRRYNIDRFGYLIPHRYGNLPMVGAVATYRPGEGRFGGAVAVEEETENLFSSITWQQGSIQSSTGLPISHNSRIRTPYIAVEPNSAYTINLFNHRDFMILNMHEYDSEDGWLGPLGGVDVPYTFTTKGTTAKVMVVVARKDETRISPKDVIIICPQLEAKPFATSFVAGTRATGGLEYPGSVLPLDEATLICWVKAHEGSPDQRRDIWAINSSVLSDDRLILGRNTVGDGWEFYFRPGGGSLSELRHNVPLDFGWHMIGFRYRYNASSDRYDLALIFDGDIVAAGTSANAGMLKNIYRLYSDGNHYAANCLIDELLILPYAASEEEIVSWYEAQGPLPPHPQASLQWDRQTVRPAQMVKL